MERLRDPEEAAWMAAMQRGEEDGLARIFEAHYHALLKHVCPLVSDLSTAEDMVQEVFTQLWLKRENLNIEGKLRPYLKRAVTNRAINHLKRHNRLTFNESPEMEEPADTPDAEVSNAREDALQRALQQLPEKCRVVFILSRFEALSHKEISDSLGVSVKTIENQITKAMKILRAALNSPTHLSWVGIAVLKFCG